MSTPTRILCAGLIDDAAVFPPGNSPLPEAVTSHRMHRQQWYAPFIGPLLVPVGATADLIPLVNDDDAGAEPLRVGLIARPGEDPTLLASAAAELHGTDGIEVVGIEAGWQPGWRSWLRDGHPMALELPRGDDQRRALEDIANASAECVDAIAKFRTGATPHWAWPDEQEFAQVIHGVVELDLSLKLTGGLHHVVRAEHDSQPQHGLLNVFAAVDAAMREADVDAVAEQLARRDPEDLADEIDSWDESRCTAVRATLTSFGCCGVTDPITELDDLDLFEEN